MRRALLLAIGLTVLALAVAAGPAAAAPKVVWLCKPGLKHNPCHPGLATTRFSPTGGRLGVSHPRRTGHPKVDCFYVYPTVSDQQTDVANRHIDPVERSIALFQAARYSQECRVFAPMYRQRTLKALFGGSTHGVVGKQGYVDVLRAWRTYLRRYNHGRGVVIVGHSQGSFVLRKLIAREVDRKRSARRRLVSAILLGGNVTNRDFKRIRPCRSRRQLHCVVAFSTYGEKPPSDAIFGHTGVKGEKVVCTNPTSLAGGSGITDTIFPGEPFAPGAIAAGIQLLHVTLPTASTPWIEVARGYRARCSSSGGIRVLRITPRGGAPAFSPSPSPDWGLHLVDANIALGNLVGLVRTQIAAYARR
ncbi:MAG TPA: DUF3089 domain-containing protein [Thermoleophilaceae bacterium]